MTTKPPSTTFMFWYTPIVNCSADAPTRSEAANHSRSKNRGSLVPTWSKVVGNWCHGVSSSEVSIWPPSTPRSGSDQRVPRDPFARERVQPLANVGERRLRLDHRYCPCEQRSCGGVPRVEGAQVERIRVACGATFEPGDIGGE